MKKKLIHISNWNQYQARSDKEMPWAKLWGSLFDKPWFQDLNDKSKLITIILIDFSRKFNNRIDENTLFSDYISRNYGVKLGKKEMFNICKSLYDNGFLSDKPSDYKDDVLDKIRQDKDKIRERHPQLKEVEVFFAELNFLAESERFFNYYEANGWTQGRGKPIKNWKAAARGWISRCDKKPAPKVDSSKDKEKLKQWKEESTPMPDEARQALSKLFGGANG